MNLIKAAEDGNIERVRELLDRGVDPNIQKTDDKISHLKINF